MMVYKAINPVVLLYMHEFSPIPALIRGYFMNSPCTSCMMASFAAVRMLLCCSIILFVNSAAYFTSLYTMYHNEIFKYDVWGGG
jgi:hypothetical protein